MSEVDGTPPVLNTYDYGFQSNHWLLKVALAYVPQKQLHFALVRLIDRMVYGENLELVDLLETIGQAAFTGRVVKTTDDAPRWGTPGAHPDATATSAPRVTMEASTQPDDLEKQIKEFSDWLTTLPEAKEKTYNKEEPTT